jgi:integrase
MSQELVPLVQGEIVDRSHLEQLLSQLAVAARIADQVAKENVLSDYRQLKRPNTQRRQRNEIALFEKFLAAMHVPLTGMADDLSLWSGMSRGLIVAFRHWLEQNHYRIGSINLCISTLRVYCELSYTAGHLSRTAWEPIGQLHNISVSEGRIVDEQRSSESVGKKKAVPTKINPAQVTLLKRKLKEYGDAVAIRDLLMVCLLADHGMRVSEVESLKRSEVDLEGVRFKIDRRKTSLKHFHGFLPDTLDAIQQYLRLCPRGPEESLLGIKIATIRWRIKRLGLLVGITNLSPHDLRHYFGTYAEGDLIDVAKAGGWTTLNMLLRYRFDLENANQNITMPSE